MEILVCIAGLVYIIYEAASNWKNKGYPESLSATYYLWPEWVFPSVMALLGFSLLPVWLENTEGSSLQFLSFLSCVGLIFVGSAPDYKKDKGQYKVHIVAAYLAAGTAILSMIFVIGGWYWIPIWLGLNILSDMKNFKKHYIYHIEDALIMSLLMNIL